MDMHNLMNMHVAHVADGYAQSHGSGMLFEVRQRRHDKEPPFAPSGFCRPRCDLPWSFLLNTLIKYLNTMPSNLCRYSHASGQAWY